MRFLLPLLLLGLVGCGADEGPRTESHDVEKPLVEKPRVEAPYTETIPGTNVSFDMVWVPDANAWMGKTEVTWDEYEAYFLAKDVAEGADAVSKPTKPYLPHDRGWGRGQMVATGISRHAAEQYCVWLSKKTGRTYRLPTEAEWEAACTGVPEDVDAEVWHYDNSEAAPQKVGTKKPNAHGLHDVLGNAWEYCSGAFAEGDERPIMRGGSWDSPVEDCTCGARMACPEEWNESDAQRPRGIWWLADGPYVGLRVVRPREP